MGAVVTVVVVWVWRILRGRQRAAVDVELATLRARVVELEATEAASASFGRGVETGLRLRVPSGGVRLGGGASGSSPGLMNTPGEQPDGVEAAVEAAAAATTT